MTELRVQLYNVWHSRLYDELYDDISQDDLSNIIMFGVNEAYTKHYTPNRYNLMFEYDLPIYDPNLQKHNYCQTSCMWHLYKNPQKTYRKPGHELDYIGFIQYDMKPEADMFADIHKAIASAKENQKEVVFHEQTEHIIQSIQWASGLALPYEKSALQHYNAHFNTSFTTYDFVHNHLIKTVPLLHTFVMSVPMFEKMMGWLDSYLGMLEAMYPEYTSNRAQCELLERCHGMFLALECASGNVVFKPLKVNHIWPLYNEKTEYHNYKEIV